MKGIVFREFIDMVESQFSLETADAVIQASSLSTHGAYTTVGTHPHQEMVDLVGNLSAHTGQTVPDLLRHFGRHLFGRFVEIHPNFTNAFTDVFSLLNALEHTIHVDVNKLYRDTELPTFSTQVRMGASRFHSVATKPRALFSGGTLYTNVSRMIVSTLSTSVC
ncbi:MAG: heme NO-binding domain-containing protein, partial [Burkholderiaceae bacterium]